MGQTTLYKVPNPVSYISEYYEIAVLAIPNTAPRVYRFVEFHGWWDEENKKPIHNLSTISPEKGLTSDEAEANYESQVQHRAREGFIYSFSPNPFGDGPIVVKVDVQ
jgi:hypothetical protein